MSSAVLENNVWSRRKYLYRRCRSNGRLFELVRRRAVAVGNTLAALRPRAYKRVLDVSVSTVLVLLASPLWLPIFALVVLSGGGVEGKERVGRCLRTFNLLRFYSNRRFVHWLLEVTRVQYLPVFWNIVKGDMSIIGPRPTPVDELDLRSGAARRRHNDRPGILCLWWIRSRANIDFGTEAETDAEYVESFSVRGDLGIALRGILALFYGSKPTEFTARPTILDIPIDNQTMDGAIEQIVEAMGTDKPEQVCFINADCANLAVKNSEYRGVLESAAINYADGIGMKLAGRFLKTGIQQNVNGTDLFPRLIKRLRNTEHSIYLLGGRPGIPEAVREWIEKYHPDTKVAGVRNGYYSPEEEAEVIRGIRESGASLLLLAFGAPKQDIWIRDNLPELGVNVGIGVGGLFDFYSGRIPRAPQWVREIGMEWFYRFSQEPQRLWKRYFVGNGLFLGRVFLAKLFKR
jgi:N-acetylglucosaminyldiphosphoundecaprenol N-acetyl-beta-D-mannosaminyltransferase